jgi:hypothetical protein
MVGTQLLTYSVWHIFHHIIIDLSRDCLSYFDVPHCTLLKLKYGS